MAQRHVSLEGFEGNVKVDKSSKGVIYADFKISKNGSYKVHLDKGTTLYFTVDINPCSKCQHKLDLTNQIASPVEGGTSQFTGFPRPSYDMESPSSGPHIQTTDAIVKRGFEESEEVNPERAQLVCSDSLKTRRR
ncbi:uncharacterized protein LOC135337036 [Halichondria panicea]|uniref:uncharacterized protein LOC135337036 n=1 Tax=Halichondria panicea TaxID=6063 RepID=UPI00312B6EEA